MRLNRTPEKCKALKIKCKVARQKCKVGAWIGFAMRNTQFYKSFTNFIPFLALM